MMNNEQFLITLKEDQNIYDLIINKHVSIFNTYGSLKNTSPDFIDWLSPLYFEAVTTLFEENLNTKTESKLVKLINAPLYCNVETKEKIVDFLNKMIQDRVSHSQKIYNQMKGNSGDLVPIVEGGGIDSHKPLNITIFNNFDHPKIQATKEDVINLGFDLCEKLKKVSTKDFIFTFFNDLIEQLSKLELSEEQQIKLDSFRKKRNRKNIYAKIGGAIVVILIILKLLSSVLS